MGCQYCNNAAELNAESLDDVIVYINDDHELIVMTDPDFIILSKTRINVCPICGAIFPEEE